MASSMDDVARVLGAELARPGAVARLRPLRAALAAAELGEPAAHVDRILERLEAAMAEEDGARVLKLTALAHELEPGRVAPTLARLGVEAPAAAAVADLVAAFWAADLWRGGGAGPRAWLRRAGPRARPLLLFEVVHEGSVTPGMIAAADLAGLRPDLERWRRRIEPVGRG